MSQLPWPLTTSYSLRDQGHLLASSVLQFSHLLNGNSRQVRGVLTVTQQPCREGLTHAA